MTHRTLLPFLGLMLLGACGQPTLPPSPYGASPENSPGLTASALTPCPACTWQDLGPQPLDVSPDHYSGGATLAVTGADSFVAWHDFSGPGAQTFVRASSGTGWTWPVKLNDAGSEGLFPTLAANPAGGVMLAFTQAMGGRAVIRVKRRMVVGAVTTWTPLDPQSDGGLSANGRAYEANLALAPDGMPYLAWSEVVGDTFKIFVRRYRHGVWQNLGANADGSLDTGNSPRIAVNANGLAVAYLQNSPDGPRVAVRRWNGSALQPVASPSTVGGVGFALALDAGGAPLVALTEYRNGNHDLLVKRRSGGGSWVTLGGPLDRTPVASAVQPSLVVTPEGTAVVWLEDGGLFTARWNPAAARWTPVGDRLNPPGNGSRPGLALGPGGVPTVAFDQGEGQLTDVRVRRFGP